MTAGREREIMKKRRSKRIAILLAMLTGMLSVCACAAQNKPEESRNEALVEENGDTAAGISGEQNTGETVNLEEQAAAAAGGRPMLLKAMGADGENSVTPCVEAYTIEPDLGNLDNLWQFYLNDEMTEKLAQNGFVVGGFAGREFFEIYEQNRYNQIPNFVTVDSLMHTYHLYFSYLLKNIEKEYLEDQLLNLSRGMLGGSMAQYEQMKGTEWEEAAKRNVAFFTVGTALLDEGTEVKDYVAEVVHTELERIGQAEGIFESEITDSKEDYTQYVPRGYYEGDGQLEQYFKAMMWYGRMHFSQENEEMDRSALLISMILLGDSDIYGLWEGIYAVTSFFAGASDDLGVCEYAPVLYEAYGEGVTLQDLPGNEEAFARFHEATGALPVPQINSVPVYMWEENVIPGFRFMGQRFTIDAMIMQKLVYRAVEENSAGEMRMLPDVLDAPAALGSDTALSILEEGGAADYKGYSENMTELRESLGQENATLWTASLYAGWLNTLRPLLTVKGEGYPVFMQNEEWLKKDLECFAGSFTELKHDTVLYSKQVLAEMGGGYYEEEPDYRGYVEPEPLVYSRFSGLAGATAQGLKEYGMLTEADEENLMRLSSIAEQLQAISEKELADTALTEEEYRFIEEYGGNIEHFWYEAVKDQGEDGMVSSQEIPAALVVDIATDPNGTVLEAATGDPAIIYVVVKVDGKIKLATGSVYTFYQFPWPMDDRLTDSKWRVMMGLQADENGYYNMDAPVSQPEWTRSYRYSYAWE